MPIDLLDWLRHMQDLVDTAVYAVPGFGLWALILWAGRPARPRG